MPLKESLDQQKRKRVKTRKEMTRNKNSMFEKLVEMHDNIFPDTYLESNATKHLIVLQSFEQWITNNSERNGRDKGKTHYFHAKYTALYLPNNATLQKYAYK